MRIGVKMTRAGNIARHGEGIAELDLEEYLCGVVPAEIGEGSHGDALRAQAVAARTFALRRVLAGIVVDDTTSFQAWEQCHGTVCYALKVYQALNAFAAPYPVFFQ